MAILDIFIYAAIAAFLAFRLWSVLGQKNGEDGAKPPRRNPFESIKDQQDRRDDEDGVRMIEGRARPVLANAALTNRDHAPTSLAGHIDEIKQIDPSFHEKKFLEGAKVAFQNIVAAFAKGDLSPVSRFLGPEVLRPFSIAIEQRNHENQTLENKIERIVAADIVNVQVEKDVATVAVEFVSHQVNVLKDRLGEILDGTPGKAEEIRDVWIFKRDLKSANPNWQLVETKS